MPLVRFKIRNELSLGASPELRRTTDAAAEDEDPKAMLTAVEVAGLVGILRQLGDLAEFSAEVFHGIQEEVTVTASRCQKLTSRVKRIESALSPLEKAVLSQTSHIHFVYTAGCEWHPRIQNSNRHFVQSDLPLFVMETYEQCRDPPPLHLLDRFAAGGPGSCLRKYSDPTFFRKELSNLNKADDIKVQRDQTHHKSKKKRLPQRKICRSHAVSTSDETSGARLSSLTDDRQTTSQSTSTADMPRTSNMQDFSGVIDQSHLQGRSNALEESEAQPQSVFEDLLQTRDSINGSGYIEYLINQSPVNNPEEKLSEGFLSRSFQPADRLGSAVPESCIEGVDDKILYVPSEELPMPCDSVVCDEKKETLDSRFEKSHKDEEASEIHESKIGPGTPDILRQNERDFDRTYILFDEVKRSQSEANNISRTPGIEDEVENISEQEESEGDEFVDARNTIESESESDPDKAPKPKLEHYFGDISTDCSEDASSDNNDGSPDIPSEQSAQDPSLDVSLDESCSAPNLSEDANVSCFLPDPVCGKPLAHDESPLAHYEPPLGHDESPLAHDEFAHDESPVAHNESAHNESPLAHDESFERSSESFSMCSPLLAEEAIQVETLQGEQPVSAHPWLAGDCIDEKISSEESVSSCLSLEDVILAEKILPEEHLVDYPSVLEVVPREKILPVECMPNNPFLEESVPNENIFSEKPFANIPSLEKVEPDSVVLAEESEDAKNLHAKAVQDAKISPKVIDSTDISAAEAGPQGHTSLEKVVETYPCLVEVVSEERVLSGEPVSTCLSLRKAGPFEEVFPEESLEVCPSEKKSLEKISHEESVDAIHPSFSEVVGPERISHEEPDDATHPSCAEADRDEKFPPEILDSTNLSVAKAVPQEQISVEELVGISPCLAEAVSDERVYGIMPEESMEAYPSLSELPKEKSSQEKLYDAAHPSFAEAVHDEISSPDILDTTNLCVVETAPHEQISLEKVTECLAETVADERILLEENVTTCQSFVPIKKVLPEEPLEDLEKSPKEKILLQKPDDTTNPSSDKAVKEENISPEVLDSSSISMAEVVQEQVSLEEFVGTYPCLAEAVSDERVLPEEPVTTCLSSTKVVPIEEVFPEESLEEFSLEKISHEESDDAIHLSFSETVGAESISHEEADDATHPSCAKAEQDEKISPETLDSSKLSVEEVVQHDQISLEELPGIYPYLAGAVLDKSILPEEASDVSSCLAEAELDENILGEEPDAIHLPFSDAVGDEKISPQGPGSTHPSLAESALHEKTSPEELAGTSLLLELAYEQIVPEEAAFTCQSLAEAGGMESVLSEESLLTCPSFAEAVPDERISLKEPDVTCPPSAEAVFDEKISDSETPGTTTEALGSTTEALGSTTDASPLNKVEPFGPSSAEAVFDEKISDLEALGSTTDAGQLNKIFHGEPVGPPSAEAAFDEKISDSETPGATTEALVPTTDVSPFNQIFHGESVGSPSAEAVYNEKISDLEAVGATTEALGSKTDSGPLVNQIYHGEPVGPPSAEAIFDEKTPDSQIHGTTTEAFGPTTDAGPPSAESVYNDKISDLEAPGATLEAPDSTREAVPLNKIFHGETGGPPAEGVIKETISDLEAPGATTEAGPLNKIFPGESVATHLSVAEVVPEDNIMAEEPSAAYMPLSEGIPDQKVFLDDAAFLSFAEAVFDLKISPEDLNSTYHPTLEPASHEKISPEMPGAYNEPYKSSEASMNPKSGYLAPESDETSSLDNNNTKVLDASAESVRFWSNGGLLGLEPSKPPVLAKPISVNDYIQNEIKEANALTSKQESSSRSVQDSLSLVLSNPNSQHNNNNNMLTHSNGSHLQSTATSFKVFGLSHKLLMAGFRGNTSTFKFEALPTSSSDTEAVLAMEDKTELNHQQTLESSSFEDQFIFDSPNSSPPVQHMTISFKDVSSVSKLKLRIPSQSQHNNGTKTDMFDTFQLVPEISSSSTHDSDSFCQSSSSCDSDNCLSDSELWESDEIHGDKDSNLSLPEEESVSSFHGEMTGSFLDLPCFDSVDQDPSSRLEEEQVGECKPSVSEIIRAWPPKANNKQP